MQYHINKNFEVKKCYAEIQVCPYQDGGHYPTAEQAQVVANAQLEEAYKLLDVSDANHPLMGEEAYLYTLYKLHTEKGVSPIFIQDDTAQYECHPLHTVYMQDDVYHDRSGVIAENEQELEAYISKTFNKDKSTFSIFNKQKSKNAIYEHLGYECDDLGQLMSHLRSRSEFYYNAGDDYTKDLLNSIHDELDKEY